MIFSIFGQGCDSLPKIKDRTNQNYNLFFDYVREVKKQNCTTEEQKFDLLLTWLNKYDDNLSYKLRLVSYLLAYIKEINGNSGKVDFIILFDNIDKLDDDAQIEILNIIFSFSIKLDIKLLVPMRLTTFGKIKGNGSYSYAIIENTGHPPISIVIDRINAFLQNPDRSTAFKEIPKEYQSLLLEKAKFLAEYLPMDSNAHRIGPFFSAIAGNSIRRGLFLAERFFLNSAFSYKDGLYQNEFLKALLVSNSENCRMSYEDRLVNNLFCSWNNTNTLLKIRILQILSFYRENAWTCKINLLISQVTLFEEYSSEEILRAINDLIFYPRRIIYVEGVKEYTDYNNLSQSMNDVVHITYAGVEYLETLLHNPVYLQNTFSVINWLVPKSFKNINYLSSYIDKIKTNEQTPAEFDFLKNGIKNKAFKITDFFSPAYDYKDIKERMTLIRDGLNLLMLNDLNQLAIYYETSGLTDVESIEDRYIKNSIIIDTIGKTSMGVLYILRGSLYNKPEIEHWYNFLIISNMWHNALFGQDNKYVLNAINSYKIELMLK